MKKKLLMASLVQLACFSQNCFSYTGIEEKTHLNEAIPVCVHPNQYNVFYIEEESKLLNTGFHPIIYLNGEEKYGFDYTIIDRAQYDIWENQCPNGYFLESYLPKVNSRTIFKVTDREKEDQFSPGASVIRIKNGSSNEYEVLSQAYDVLRRLAVNNVDKDVRHFLENPDNGYTINFTTLHDEKGSYVDFQEKLIQINLLDLGLAYLTTAQLESEFTLQRLITHEVLHAAAPLGTSETEVIRRTNILLFDLGYTDAARMPGPQIEHDNLRYAYRSIGPAPKPGQQFKAFFNRPTKEFVSDPFMWISAIFSAPSFGGASMSLSRISTNIVKPRIPYQPLGSARTIPRTNSITSVNSFAAPVASSLSSSIETAPVETLASSSGGDAASVETLESPSIRTEPNGLKDGPMSIKERETFVNKVDEELQSLHIGLNEKMSIQFKLSPTAHYLNQAPDLVRQFLRSEITVMELYRQMPI